MVVREILQALKDRHGAAVIRADSSGPRRLYVFVDPAAIAEVCRQLFRDMDARYVISIGSDDRPFSGNFLVAHHFAFDRDGLLCSVLANVPADQPRIQTICHHVPAANWAEREIQDLLGVESIGHPYPKRLVVPDGWPQDAFPLRKDFAWNQVPQGFDENKPFQFDEPPPGCMVIPFGPFHPTLDEPAHFRLYVEGEWVRGCEYRGFMVHRGIEKLAESVLSYNDIPIMAERICGICGCVHNVAYAQAVEEAAGLQPPPRALFLRTIMLEIERLHSHLLWTGLACHLLGFDTLFMHSFRIREPIMWIAEKISGNRKTYGLCVIGGVRRDISAEHAGELRQVLDKLQAEWQSVVSAVAKDKNLQKRSRGVGVAGKELVKEVGLIGPVARAAGADIDCRRDHPYAAYDRVEFEVITECGADVWSRILVRAREVFESIRIIRQCLNKMEAGPIQSPITDELPVARMGMSSVEAPRGEAHHFVITGENNRPRRWRVRAPTYQNLQGVPAMIKDQRLADMTISLGSIDPCFSCTDRLETVDIKSKQIRVWSSEELEQLAEAAERETMLQHVMFQILGGIANVLLVLLAAPLCDGIGRKLTAIVQSRKGPPVLQPYFDLLKLLGKEDIESGPSPIMQRLAAYLSLTSVLTLACLIPMGFASPLNSAVDAIVLIYLLTLCGICTLLAGLAAGSTYSLIGVSREMVTMITLEPLLAIAILVGALRTHSLLLQRILDGSLYSGGWPFVSGLIMLAVFALAFQGFVQRLPFDITEAETEIMEGSLMEYSGPKLALLKYSQMCRLVIYCSLLVALFLPWGSALVLPISWLVFWAKVLALVAAVTLVAATHARYRIDQAVRYFAALLLVSLGALVLASFGL